MDSQYHPKLIEAATQSEWTRADAYRVHEDALDPHGKPKPKFYACSMLPYPSGKLHMGHVRNYTINDVMLRYLRMKGYNVLMPMGWDAFGLPAENAAMANNESPAKWTYANIADMKAQMQPLGLAFDWSREITTCKPEYYKWNQWLFLKMLEKGIAYRKTQVVNWDPVDQTVLANEQVIDGRGWRSGAPVEKREIPGYYLAITQYAEELIDHVSHKLPGWPERVRVMQENWIGKSVGVRFAFPHAVKDAAGNLVQDGKLFVFTTRADTIMGVTFCAVAPEHPLAQHAAASNPAVAKFIEQAKLGGTTEAEIALKEKEGVDSGLVVTHPLTSEQIPVWVGNYVLMTYGDGAVMGVPAHDGRDFEFAKKYSIPIKQVIGNTLTYTDALRQKYPVSEYAAFYYEHKKWKPWYESKSIDEVLVINSGKYDGQSHAEAVDAVATDLALLGLGEKKIQYRLRDWGISRQRYWGTPIPLIHCADCGVVPVPEKDLPVVLPEDCIPDGSGNPLNKHAGFLNVSCPECGRAARRETDTMDTFVDSSWYYMRYCSPDANDSMVDARNDYWMPMDQYIGGIEHAVLHLLYARFWTKVMRDLNLVHFDEPFTNLFTQGMLSAESFYRTDAAGKTRWYYPDEVEVKHDEKGRPTGALAREDGATVMLGGMEKMSKSKNNVVEPKDIIERYGADTARAYVMFAGPPDQSAAWSDSGAGGVYRFLQRLWSYCATHREAMRANGIGAKSAALRFTVHSLLKQAQYDFDHLKYNTVVSACMKMLNAIEDAGQEAGAARNECISILLRVLYPLAPHIAHQLWRDLGIANEAGDIIDAPWPTVDPVALEQDEIELVVQVNGKLRGHICVPKDAAKEAVEQIALNDEGVKRHTEGKPIKKIIVVPGKLVNVVV